MGSVRPLDDSLGRVADSLRLKILQADARKPANRRSATFQLVASGRSARDVSRPNYRTQVLFVCSSAPVFFLYQVVEDICVQVHKRFYFEASFSNPTAAAAPNCSDSRPNHNANKGSDSSGSPSPLHSAVDSVRICNRAHCCYRRGPHFRIANQ